MSLHLSHPCVRVRVCVLCVCVCVRVCVCVCVCVCDVLSSHHTELDTPGDALNTLIMNLPPLTQLRVLRLDGKLGFWMRDIRSSCCMRIRIIVFRLQCVSVNALLFV
jgi:hypothetical protein